MLINIAPLCPNHSILAMYPDEELPQIIGQDIVLLLLNLFKLFPNLKYLSLDLGIYNFIKNRLQLDRGGGSRQPPALPPGLRGRFSGRASPASGEREGHPLEEDQPGQPSGGNQPGTPFLMQYSVGVLIEDLDC